MLKKFLCYLLMAAVVILTIPVKTHAAVLPWEAMVNSTQTGVRAPGFGDVNNIFVSSMATFNGYLYTATYNDPTGTEVWRTNNGTSWEQANTDNFGGGMVEGFSTLAVFNNQLYAFRSLMAPFGVAAYRTSNGTTWELAEDDIANDLNSGAAFAAAVYNGVFYVGLADQDGHGIIVSSADGSTWAKVFDRNLAGTMIPSMATFNGRLYFGVYNLNNGGEVYYFDGLAWTQDNVDGFDNNENVTVASLTNFNGVLYATTDNDTTGAEVWKRTADLTWIKVTDAGFGQGAGTANTFTSEVFNGYFYVGADNAKVFRSSDGASWEQVNTNGFGFQDNVIVMLGILGDYIYAGVGSIPQPGGPNTVEIYRYGTPSAPAPAATLTTLPATGAKQMPLFYRVLNYLIQLYFK